MSILCGLSVCVSRRGTCIKNAQHFCLLIWLGPGHIFSSQGWKSDGCDCGCGWFEKWVGKQLSGGQRRRLNTQTLTHIYIWSALRAKQIQPRRRCCCKFFFVFFLLWNLLPNGLCTRINLDSEHVSLSIVSLEKLKNCRATKTARHMCSQIYISFLGLFWRGQSEERRYGNSFSKWMQPKATFEYKNLLSIYIS